MAGIKCCGFFLGMEKFTMRFFFFHIFQEFKELVDEFVNVGNWTLLFFNLHTIKKYPFWGSDYHTKIRLLGKTLEF